MAETTGKADTTARRRSRDSERGDIVRDATRLAWAWTQAWNQAFFDTIQVWGDLTTDVTDSLFGRGTRRTDRTDTEGRQRRGYNLANDITDSFSRAIRDSADVMSRSGQTLNRLYNEERASDDQASEHESADRVITNP